MQQNAHQHPTDPWQGQKLTKWKNEPSIQQLKMDLEAAKPFHDNQQSRIQKWNDDMAVKGSAAIPKVKGRSSVQPKLIRRQAEWRYSALTEPFLGSDKLFSVKPVTFEDDAPAKQNELVLNWQFNTKLNKGCKKSFLYISIFNICCKAVNKLVLKRTNRGFKTIVECRTKQKLKPVDIF